MEVKVGEYTISDKHPVFFVAEIGINHNGDIELAKKLIDIAKIAGCTAVKFQKRNPEEAVPEKYKNVKRETPWGIISYLEYKKKIEFEKEEYDVIDNYCKKREILWSASPWDITSIRFLDSYNLPFIKVPSALITNKEYLEEIKRRKDNGTPIFLSTGMADIELVKKVVDFLGEENLVILYTVSTYPSKPEEIDLNIINTYKKLFNCPIGYSGHEIGLQITLAAVEKGAKVIERHITVDRSMWGTDQSASLESIGLIKLLRDIRIIEKCMRDGIKRKLDTELEIEKKLRKVYSL